MSAMALEYIRKTYNVPAKRGGRIKHTSGDEVRFGTIASARGAYLRVRWDNTQRLVSLHPTWGVEYCAQGKTSNAD